MHNSVFELAVLDLEGSTLKHNYVKTTISGNNVGQ